jgi:hypothetical protein
LLLLLLISSVLLSLQLSSASSFGSLRRMDVKHDLYNKIWQKLLVSAKDMLATWFLCLGEGSFYDAVSKWVIQQPMVG